MALLKRTLWATFILGFLAIGVFVYFNFYSYIFSRRVVGVIQKVERIQLNVSLMQTGPTGSVNPQLHSFAVAIKESSGEIVTASAEDRQWAVAQAGQCAEAVFYPYPFWKLDKANTYFGARLEKLFDCQGQAR